MLKLSTCILLFVLGWSKFALPLPWLYFADYILRIMLIGIGWSLVTSTMQSLNFPKYKVWLSAFAVCWVLLLAERLFGNTPAMSWLDNLLFNSVGFPYPDETWLVAFDYVVGLFLVGISEELVFRGMFLSVAQDLKWSKTRLYVLSSLAFGLIHLPQGVESTLEGIVWGFVLMYFYRKSQSLWFVILIHYAINLWFFGHRHWGEWIEAISSL